ncbi:MAG: HlyD family secretion protein [Hyphomicrobium sp.]
MKLSVGQRTGYDDVASTPTDWSSTDPWVRFGARAIVALFAGGLFATFILSSPTTVIRTGTVVAQGAPQPAPSTYSGVVMKILIQDGDFVEAGQPILVLDDAEARAGVAATASRLTAYAIQEARLTAERDLKDAFQPPATIDSADVETASLVAAERAVFEERRAARSDRHKSLARRLPQVERELAEATARLAKLQKDRDQNERELSALGAAFNGAAAANPQRVGALQRESVRIGADLSAARTEAAKLKGARAEVESLLAQSSKQYSIEATEALAHLRSLIAEATDAKSALDRRIAAAGVVTAPSTGTIHALAAPPVGDSVQQGDVLAQILPGDGGLLVSVRLTRDSSGDVAEGAAASVRLPSSFASAAPWLPGRVRSVSSDPGADAAATALIAVPRSETGRGTPALPGAPVEVVFEDAAKSSPAVAMTPVGDAFARTPR